ncbi:ABC transporter ATP-binding protein [Arenicella sp. 4NH20-0111]|uniref:ABC transporter ATP-binding protein n=1 Tax=Arenicella sp. 4NH20-0111 TaxID=3127648 RepID=UPI003340FE81
MSKNYLVAQNVGRVVDTEFGELEILNDVSMSVKIGKSVAVKGASGSGKSTLLTLLAGLDVPQTGSVELKGQCLSALNEDQRAMLRANKIGFVFQAFNLIDELTAIENVTLPMELFGWENATEKAAETLAGLGLQRRLHHFPKQLSGGEQQRVALARAFAIDPELVIADEPTANLDADNAERVLDFLFRLQAERNTSMVIATHDESLANRCDEVVLLSQGEIVDSSVLRREEATQDIIKGEMT